MKNLLHLFTLPVFLFCGFLQVGGLKPDMADNENYTISKSQIVYLFFEVKKSDSGLEKIILQNKKVAEGKLKFTPPFDRNSVNNGDFIVSLTDSNGKEIVKQMVEDPLNPKMENFDNGIGRHELSLQNAEFSIRYSHSDEIKIVKIEKVTKEGNQVLFIQKL